MTDIMRYDSPIGGLLLAGRDGALTGLWIEGQKYFPGPLGEEARENPDSAVLRRAAPRARREPVPQRGVGHFVRNPLRGHHDLRGDRAKDRRPPGAREAVRPGGGRGGGA